MLCKKCKKEIPDGSLFCNHCGKKQTTTTARHRKRAHGTGTIYKDTRYKSQYLAYAPATAHGAGRVYIGSFSTVKEAQRAAENFIQKGRPELYGATLSNIYALWSDTHFKQIQNPKIIQAMWKKYEPLYNIKIADIRAAHFQPIVDSATSKSAASKLKSLAFMLCNYALENDIVEKNYAQFIKIPKYEKTEKIIFTAAQISELWRHTDDKRYQVILSMIYMGFRLGEMLLLTPETIFLDDGYVIGGIKTEAGKNRVIPFPSSIPEIAGFFRSWLTGLDSSEKLFPMDAKQFRHFFFYQPLSELGMIDGHLRADAGNSWTFNNKNHLTPHSTRHTFASLSAAAGMRPDNLQKIIGHADYSTTAEIYIHKNIAELKDEMSKLRK